MTNFAIHLARPATDRDGDELRTIVTADLPWDSAHSEQLCQRVDHVFARNAACHFQRQALPRVLVDNAQPLERAARGRAVKHEVPTPNMVFVLCTTTIAAIDAAPQPPAVFAAFVVLLGPLDATPETLSLNWRTNLQRPAASRFSDN